MVPTLTRNYSLRNKIMSSQNMYATTKQLVSQQNRLANSHLEIVKNTMNKSSVSFDSTPGEDTYRDNHGGGLRLVEHG